MDKRLTNSFYKDFMSITKDIRIYLKIYDKQNSENMSKFSRHACLYKIFEYYEYTATVFTNKMEQDKVYMAGGYPVKLNYYCEKGLVTKDVKQTLTIVCNSRNRLIHDTEISLIEKERLENKLISYFKDEWFVRLVANLYENTRNTKRMEL